MKAKKFMRKTGSTMDIEFLGTLYNDEWNHHRYEVTLQTRRGSYVFIYNMGLAHAVGECTYKEVLPGIGYEVPITFDEFCSDFGYDNDSIKASGIYDALKDEAAALAEMYTTKELAQLASVQE